ncbi:MAG: Do family serine endopeptidase [Bacteroidales bacterium]|jgi:serine protease Do|nr:Do family serine endopeptidase [Bacteroidales bacterium]
MKKFWRNFLIVLSLVLLSAGVSYLTVSKLSDRLVRPLEERSFNHGEQPMRLVKAEVVPAIETDFTRAASQTVHAVVHIASKTMRSVGSSGPMDIFEYIFGYRDYNQTPKPQTGYGSGVIISADGYIVTNNHVIEGADEISVTLNDRRNYQAKVIGTDPSTDIALIKIEEKGLSFITFGNSDELKVGEWVLAVGNPLNLTSTVTAGIVSAKGRSIGILGGNNRAQRDKSYSNLSIESFIQTDAAVNPGNSGGALVNTRGELVGINTAIISSSNAFSGYSFAVPVSIVKKVVTDIKEYGSVQRAILGIDISDITPELSKEKKIDVTEGVYIHAVGERSGALDAGVKEGDIVIAVDGEKVTRAAELQEKISRYRPGDKVRLTVLRDKKELNMNVVLRNLQGSTTIVKEAGIEVLGAAFNELSANEKRQLNISYGIRVGGLTEGKLKEAGVRKGFIILKVNDQRIESVADFEKIVRDVQKNAGFGEAALFIVGIYPSGKVAYYAIDLTQ